MGDAKSDQIGAKRVLNGAFHETLIGLNDDERSFAYSIDDGPGAVAKDSVSGYVGRVRVYSVTAGDTTFVESSSTSTASEGRVNELCDPVYQALLGALAAKYV